MYNKYLVLVVVIFSLIAGEQIAAAAGAQTKDFSKPTVAVLLVNNAKSTYDEVVSRRMLDDINGFSGKYNIVPGDRYIERLNQNGIADITTAERSDIVDALKGEPVNYVLFVEVQPFVVNNRYALFNHGVGLTAIVPVKIIDLANKRYFYNGKFIEHAGDYVVVGGVGSKSVAMKVLDKVIAKMNPVIQAKLPLN